MLSFRKKEEETVERKPNDGWYATVEAGNVLRIAVCGACRPSASNRYSVAFQAICLSADAGCPLCYILRTIVHTIVHNYPLTHFRPMPTASKPKPKPKPAFRRPILALKALGLSSSRSPRTFQSRRLRSCGPMLACVYSFSNHNYRSSSRYVLYKVRYTCFWKDHTPMYLRHHAPLSFNPSIPEETWHYDIRHSSTAHYQVAEQMLRTQCLRSLRIAPMPTSSSL